MRSLNTTELWTIASLICPAYVAVSECMYAIRERFTDLWLFPWTNSALLWWRVHWCGTQQIALPFKVKLPLGRRPPLLFKSLVTFACFLTYVAWSSKAITCKTSCIVQPTNPDSPCVLRMAQVSWHWYASRMWAWNVWVVGKAIKYVKKKKITGMKRSWKLSDQSPKITIWQFNLQILSI